MLVHCSLLLIGLLTHMELRISPVQSNDRHRGVVCRYAAPYGSKGVVGNSPRAPPFRGRVFRQQGAVQEFLSVCYLEQPAATAPV
jgi:hypothetical protein